MSEYRIKRQAERLFNGHEWEADISSHTMVQSPIMLSGKKRKKEGDGDEMMKTNWSPVQLLT